MAMIRTSIMAYVFYAIISMSIFSSCNDDEPKDTTLPQLEFENVTEGQDVWNTVTVTFNATDDKGVDKIDVYVDGNLFTTINDAPFEISWDSNTVPDGVHSIKAVVIDQAGNQLEKEITLNVKNTLISFQIAADHLYSDDEQTERGVVFLSDENGNLITSVEFKNGQSVTLKSSAFNGEKFFLSEARLENYGNGEFASINTYPDIERGKSWVIEDDRDVETVYVGTANLTYTNGKQDYEYRMTAPFDQTFAYETSGQTALSLTKSSSKLFVTSSLFTENGYTGHKYYLYPNVAVGNNNINLGLVNKDLTKALFTAPQGTLNAWCDVYGYTTVNDYTSPFEISTAYSDASGKVEILYPGTEFPSYISEYGYETDDVYFYGASRSKFFEGKSFQKNVSFGFSNDKLTYSASGDFDIMSLNYEILENYIYWYIILPKGENKVVPKFQLPKEINNGTAASPASPNDYSLYDFETISDYEGFKNFIRNSKNGTFELSATGKEYSELIYKNVPINGRQKSNGRIISTDKKRHKNYRPLRR